MRLFIAIQFNQEILDQLNTVIEEVKSHAQRGNFTCPENLHLTVVFIGETDRVEVVKRIMDEVALEPFVLTFKGIGRFRRGGGHLYWMGVEPNKMLTAVYQQLAKKLIAAGFDIEKREYKPHLTLGRQVVLEPDFDWKALDRAVLLPDVVVDKINLMESVRIAGKLVYREVYAVGKKP